MCCMIAGCYSVTLTFRHFSCVVPFRLAMTMPVPGAVAVEHCREPVDFLNKYFPL